MNDVAVKEWAVHQAKICSTPQDYFVWRCARTVSMNCPTETILSLLLKLSGVTVDGYNVEGNTALSLTVMGDTIRGTCSVGIITWLLCRGAKINDYCPGLRTFGCPMIPLLYASYKGHDPLVHMLVNLGANVNKTTCCEGEAPIHLCLTRSPGRDFESYKQTIIDTVNILVEAGADINQLTSRRHFEIRRYAAVSCATDVVNVYAALYLLSLNCDPDGGYDPNSELSSPSPLSLALKNRMHVFALVLVMLGCRLDRLEVPSLEQVPEWLRVKLTNPHSLKDLCLASVRKSLRGGPCGAGGGTVVGGGGGYQRLEAAVRGLPLPICLKRRVLMVGLRKLMRENEASFCSRGDGIFMMNGLVQRYSASESVYSRDDDNDTFYDYVVM